MEFLRLPSPWHTVKPNRTRPTEHLALLESHLAGKVEQLFVLQGSMPKQQRADELASPEALEESAPRVLVAIASLVGEVFDHPPLNTLVLAMPVSWEGSLKRYAGRLHRAHKSDVRNYDYVETEHAQLARMWEKPRKAYTAMGYRIVTESSPSQTLSD